MRSVLKGTLLTESLRLGAVLEVPGLRATRVYRSDVSDSSTSAQPTLWTFLEFEADDEVAEHLSHALAGSLMPVGGWYADFTVGNDHVVVFANRIFRYPRGDRAGRAQAQAYGETVGVPTHQLDWVD